MSLILVALGDLANQHRRHTRPRPRRGFKGPVGIAADVGQVVVSAERADADAADGGGHLGQPGPGQHPAVPAPRRRQDGDRDREAHLRRAGRRAGWRSSAYMAGFVLLLAFMGWITFFDILRVAAAVAMDGAAVHGRGADPSAVDVGGVVVGGGHPIVVQSMTNTDTADADATAIQVGAAGPCRQRAGPDHRQQRGGRGRRSGDRRARFAASARPCRSSATSTTTATSC